MAIEFNSVEELYKRVRPALTSKVREFRRKKINYIKEEDIWNYLVEFKWKTGKDLELFHIVDDILNTDNKKIEEYVVNKMKDFKRDINFNDVNFTC